MIIATIVVALSFTACSKNEISTLSIADAQGVIPGTYKVNYYGDTFGDGGPLSGYTFEFNSNGTLTVSNVAETFSGTWVIQSIANETYDKQVSIAIEGSPEVDALNYEWMVVEVTDVTLQLADEAAVGEIHFVKI